VEVVFRSKVDIWLIALVIGIPLLVLEFVFEGTGVGERGEDLLALTIVIAVLALFAWVYATTRYTITETHLFVKSGPFSWVIPIADIVRIEPTRSPASSPALSLDRLRIQYGAGGELMVSPANQQGFMMALRRQMKAREADRH
jgi:membrane protein YdbS with pleckstrin-like domain